jgi:hypothetical protein
MGRLSQKRPIVRQMTYQMECNVINESLQYVLSDVTQIITAIGVIITAASSIYNRFQIKKVADKVEEVHAATNGIVTKLITVKNEQIASAKAETVAVKLEAGHVSNNSTNR